MARQQNLFDFTTELDVPVGPSGMAEELLRQVIDVRAKLVAKCVSGGCKTMESYADAVGGIRQLDFVLKFAERQANAVKDSLGPMVEEEPE